MSSYLQSYKDDDYRVAEITTQKPVGLHSNAISPLEHHSMQVTGSIRFLQQMQGLVHGDAVI
jgi:hypothetical protein